MFLNHTVVADKEPAPTSPSTSVDPLGVFAVHLQSHCSDLGLDWQSKASLVSKMFSVLMHPLTALFSCPHF
jgi:hypothetical protein